MSKPKFPFFDRNETNNTEPPAGKKNAGAKSGKPEAAQFFNWLWVQSWKWFRGLQGGYADIVIGTSAEVTAKEATHTVSDFVAALADDDHVLVLAGAAHTLVRNEDITESRVRIEFEQGATLAFSTFTLTISGDENRFTGKLDGVGAADLILSGDHNEAKVWIANAGVAPISDTGTGNIHTLFEV